MSWSGRVRAPECGFSAANYREGANSRQRIASTPAPPSHYPIGRIRKETIQEAARDPGRPEKATARPVARRSHAHPSALARADSRGENLLALLAQLALRPDVPVKRHGGDPKFAAERGHGGVAVVVSICAPCPVSTRRPTPRADRVCTVSTEWARLRPRRASFQTTSTSPARRARMQLSSPGRSSRAPVAKSWSVARRLL